MEAGGEAVGDVGPDSETLPGCAQKGKVWMTGGREE